MIVVNPAISKSGYKVFEQNFTIKGSPNYYGTATAEVSIPGISAWKLEHIFILGKVNNSIWTTPGMDAVSFPLHYQAVSCNDSYVNMGIRVELQNDKLLFTVGSIGGDGSVMSIQLCVIYKE